MKKVKCAICGQRNGKRMCKLYDQKMICPRCCAQLRNPDCERCPHYAVAQRYARSKTARPEPEHFIMEIDPEIEEVVDRALTLVEQGKLKAGEAIISKLKGEHPDNYWVNYAMGVVRSLNGEYDEAIVYFDKAISIFPYFVEAYFNKAVAHKSKNDIIDMIKAFQRVVEFGDREDDLVRQAQDILGDIEQSIKKSDGMDLDLYIESGERFTEAVSFMEKREWEKAIDSFQESLSKNKNHVQSYGNLGICYAQIGKKAEAIRAIEEAIRLDPTYEPAITNRIIIESLEEGERLGLDVKSIDYYKEQFLEEEKILGHPLT